jgi:hypothetical protein
LAAVAPNPQPSPSAGGPFSTGGVGLVESDFRLVTTENGFGEGFNSYAHSMAWFEGRLYVGTTRGVSASVKAATDTPMSKPWPTLTSDDVYDIDRRAQIWQYNPVTDKWRRVYQAMWVPCKDGRPGPRYMGFRGMRIYQGPRDPKPCLYVSTWAPSRVEPPNLLRTEDGEHFEMMPRPPWGETVRSFRALQPFKGRMHTSPTGSTGKSDVSSDATVYCTEDIRYPNWTPASQHGFGNPRNVTIFEMGTFNDHLYATMANPWGGAQIFKTDGEGGPPYKWTMVLERGAYRGVFNEGVSAICEFKGALYMGTGIANGGFHREFQVGPAAAELIRLWPDDTWDLIMGNPRTTPQGLKVPLSGYHAGFDNFFNGYVWRMAVHDGHLYAGTFNWIQSLPYMPMEMWPEDAAHVLQRWGLETLLRNYGGCELWRTADGVSWENVTRSGFGNKFNWGIRNMVSTPHGLFVGTANVFGKYVAVQREGRWMYLPNPRGGLEIWLGRPRAGEASRNGGATT